MSDEIAMLDPLGLGVNLREVDTSRPVLKEGEYLMSIKELSIVPKKDDPSKRNLLAILALAQESESLEGEPIKEGFTVRYYMPLQQSDKEGAEDFKKKLVRFMCATFQLDEKDKESRPENFPPLSDFVGQQVTAVLGVDDDDTGKSNGVKYVKSAS